MHRFLLPGTANLLLLCPVGTLTFSKPKILIFLFSFFCPYSFLIYTIFKMSFSRFLFFSFISSQIVEPYQKKKNWHKTPWHTKISPGTLEFAGACPMGTVCSNPKKRPGQRAPLCHLNQYLVSLLNRLH